VLSCVHVHHVLDLPDIVPVLPDIVPVLPDIVLGHAQTYIDLDLGIRFVRQVHQLFANCVGLDPREDHETRDGEETVKPVVAAVFGDVLSPDCSHDSKNSLLPILSSYAIS
jgi:hypothetical protein